MTMLYSTCGRNFDHWEDGKVEAGFCGSYCCTGEIEG